MRMTTAQLMALLGGVTGIVSAIIGDDVASALKPLSDLFFVGDSSIHPGLLFGLVIGLGLWRAGERRPWAIALAFLATLLAWSAAVNTALWIFERKEVGALIGARPAGSATRDATLTIQLLAGLVAGIVGAAITVFGLAIANASLRQPAPAVRTIAIGAVAGLLLYPLLAGWDETLSLALLFTVWQAGVGGSLGAAIDGDRAA